MTHPPHEEPANILVVDDTPANLLLLVSMLTERGYRVRPVASGELALRAAQASPPDLILLDVTMPGLDGYEVCRRLKARERTRDIPVLFLSALTDAVDKVVAFQVGGVDYVTKPFQIDEVTARIQTHLELRRQRVALAENLRQLQELESLRENLTHMVVHDMRSPLLGLGLSLELLQELLPGADANVASLLADSRLCVGNLSEMATLMLDLGRLEAGRMPLDREPINLNGMVQDVLGALARQAGERKLQSAAAAEFTVSADRGLLRRVLVNLVANAIKYTARDGRITVALDLAPETIGAIRLEVADDGPGIPLAKQASLFQKFAQADVADARRGSGLGLAFVRMAIEAHGGRVGVISDTGQGSRFWLTLPVAAPA